LHLDVVRVALEKHMGMAVLKDVVKRSLLPNKSMYLKTYFGLAAGSVIHVNPQQELRRYFGLDETQLLPVYRRLLQPGMSVFDVGASTGHNAVGFARATRGPVVAFEADPELADILRSVIARNALSIAVESGYVGDGATPDTISLDQAAERHFFPDFVKLDIEGWEAQALAGAAKLLARRRTSFVIETHGEDVEKACVAILENHGYRLTFMEPNATEKKFRPLAHNRWMIAEPA
jgi:precorrin-6B methylase 2